jgi:hypothetical protein
MVRSPPLAARLESWIGSLIRWRSVRSCRICFTRWCGVCRAMSGSPCRCRMLTAAAWSACHTTPLAQGGVDLVVHLNPATTQDQPQGAARGDRSVQRNRDAPAAIEAGHGEPHVATLDQGEDPELVGAYHDLVGGVVLAARPVPAHLPAQVPVAGPPVGLQRTEKPLPLRPGGGVAADRPPHLDLGRLAVGRDVGHRIADGFLPRVSQHSERVGGAVGHPPVPYRPILQAGTGDGAVPLPHQRPDPPEAAGLLGQRGELPRVQAVRIRDTGDLHRPPPVDDDAAPRLIETRKQSPFERRCHRSAAARTPAASRQSALGLPPAYGARRVPGAFRELPDPVNLAHHERLNTTLSKKLRTSQNSSSGSPGTMVAA